MKPSNNNNSFLNGGRALPSLFQPIVLVSILPLVIATILAQFALLAKGNQILTTGAVFTVLNNKSRQPISGVFADLADGAILNVKGNQLQASYEGGDGNDLTLTVVP